MKQEAVLLFVDAVEDDGAWLLLGDGRHRVPRAILPPGTGEGSWLRLSPAEPPPEASAIQSRRAQLLGDDPGGKIEL